MLTVSAIVVTYFPELSTLKKLLEALKCQVEQVIVVDNGSPAEIVDDIRVLLSEKDTLISNQNNLGVAAAINLGIDQADKESTNHIVIFDQDSLPAKNMIKNLLAVLCEKNRHGEKVAAVGPNYTDTRGKHISPFVKLKGLKLHRVPCEENEVVDVDHLISSGCLISKDVLRDVGNMNEALFIDYVDTEWCLRAIHKGYSLSGVGSAHMQHSLGDEVIRYFGRNFHVRTSLRYYYLIRNGCWLLLQSWIPMRWRLVDFFRLFILYFLCALLIGNKFANWKIMNKGILHALLGKLGPFS